jgi:hypothetical protein
VGPLLAQLGPQLLRLPLERGGELGFGGTGGPLGGGTGGGEAHEQGHPDERQASEEGEQDGGGHVGDGTDEV